MRAGAAPGFIALRTAHGRVLRLTFPPFTVLYMALEAAAGLGLLAGMEHAVGVDAGECSLSFISDVTVMPGPYRGAYQFGAEATVGAV